MVNPAAATTKIPVKAPTIILRPRLALLLFHNYQSWLVMSSTELDFLSMIFRGEKSRINDSAELIANANTVTQNCILYSLAARSQLYISTHKQQYLFTNTGAFFNGLSLCRCLLTKMQYFWLNNLKELARRMS